MSLPSLLRIAEVMNVKVTDLLDGLGEMDSSDANNVHPRATPQETHGSGPRR
jgi:hypothetical protein